MDTFYDPLRVHIKVFFFTTSATGSRGDVFVVRTSKLANDHFDDWYGAALNLPMCNHVKKEEKALCLAVVFDELFGGGSLL